MVGAKEYAYTDAAVKAAYILNITHFVDFPERKHVELCIIGDDLIGVSIASQQVNNSEAFERVSISKREPNATLDSCNMVYISAQQSDKLGIILYKTDQFSILTISDIPAFSRKGGMIELAIVKNKVQMYIDQALAARHGLGLSAKLLNFSKQVHQE
jgi:YfiR/HmsC-like